MKLGELFYTIGLRHQEAMQGLDDIAQKADEVDKAVTESLDFEDIGAQIEQDLSGSADRAFRYAIIQGARDAGNAIREHVVASVKKAEEAFIALANTAGKGVQAVGSGLQSIGGKITSWVTKPIMGAVTALSGLALGKGFARLQGIDEARAKLTALKLDAKEVDEVMDAALASVKGTAFGMGEAATTAAGAFAAGISESKDLERYLTSVADAAAVAGVGMDEMGAVFNKVATSGRATNAELQQLAGRGLPVYQWLADEIGTTTEAVVEMASEGEISLETFRNAVENNIGGAAAIMGAESFSAAFANVGAAIGRVGANFLYGDGEANSFFETVKRGLTDMISLLDPIEDIAKDLGHEFGRFFGRFGKDLEKFTKTFQKWNKDQQKAWITNKAKMVAFIAAIGPLITIMGKVLKASGKLGLAINKLGLGALGAVGSFGALGAGIGAVALMFGVLPEEMRNALNDMLDATREKIPQIVDFIKEYISEKLPKALAEGFATLGNVFDTLGDVFEGLGEVAASIIDGITEGMKENEGAWADAAVGMMVSLGHALGSTGISFLSLGAQIVTDLANAIAANADNIVQGAIDLIKKFAAFVGGDEVSEMGDAGLNMVKSLGKAISEHKGEIGGAAVDLLTAFAKALVSNWKVVGVVAAGSITKGLLSKFTAAIPSMLAAGAKWAVGLASGFLSLKAILFVIAAGIAVWIVSKIDFEKLKEAGIQLKDRLVEGVSEGWEQLKEKGRELKEAFVAGVSEGWETLTETGREMKENFLTGVSENWEIVKEKGAELRDGFVDGINEGIETVQDIGRAVKQFFIGGLDEDGEEGGILTKGYQAATEFKDGIVERLGSIFEAGMETVTNFINGIKSFFDGIFSSGSESSSKFIDGVRARWDAVMTAGRETLQKMRSGLMERAEEFKDRGRELVEGLRERARGVSLVSVGRGIINGLWDGMKSVWNSVSSWFSEKMNWLGSKARSILGINSPSRVFMAIGGGVMEGLDDGMTDGFRDVQSTLTDSFHSLIDTANGFELPEKALELGVNSSIHEMELGLTPTFEDLMNEQQEQEERQYTISLLERMGDALADLLDKDTDIYLDGRKVAEGVRDDLNYLNDLDARRRTRIQGGRFA